MYQLKLIFAKVFLPDCIKLSVWLHGKIFERPLPPVPQTGSVPLQSLFSFPQHCHPDETPFCSHAHFSSNN